MTRPADTLLCVFCLGSTAISSLLGCASDSPTATATATATATSPDRRTRSLDLIVPESTSDPASLDDGALAAAIDAGNRRVNELTGRSLRHAAEHTGNDLAGDPVYRKLLHDMKAAETELGRLEMERDVRARKQ